MFVDPENLHVWAHNLVTELVTRMPGTDVVELVKKHARELLTEPSPSPSPSPNPKDAAAIQELRVPLNVVPDTLMIWATPGFYEGALKYGAFNFRVSDIKASIYIDAFERHWTKWKNGEDLDPKSQVHHLSNALAGLGIIVDSITTGRLIDDRPPRAPIKRLLDSTQATINHLFGLFGGRGVKGFTSKDGVSVESISDGPQ